MDSKTALENLEKRSVGSFSGVKVRHFVIAKEEHEAILEHIAELEEKVIKAFELGIKEGELLE